MGGEALTQNGKPVDLAEPTTQVTNGPPGGELGSAYSGEPLFQTYDGGKAFAVGDWSETNYEDMMDRDGKVKSLEQVLTLPLRSKAWRIEGAAGDSGEADFLSEVLTTPANIGGMSTPMNLVIGQMTSATWLRRAYFEKVFAIDGGRVVYDKIAFRPARTCWLLRDKGTYAFQGFQQKFRRDNDYVEVTIPPAKAFVYIHGQYRDPLYGTSDLKTAYSLFQSKQKVRFLWYSFLENQTIPKAVAQSGKADPKEQLDFAKKVASLKGGGVIGIGPDQSVDAFESSGTGAGIFQQALHFLNAEMAASVLAGFTELTSAASQGRGSYALSKDQTDFFLGSRQAVLDEMASVINNFLVPDPILWNFGAGAAMPTLKFEPLTEGEAEQALQLLQAMAARPDVTITQTFLDLLTEKVAATLDLDVDAVHQAIQGRGEGNPADRLTTGIDAATRLVAEAMGTPPPPAQAAA